MLAFVRTRAPQAQTMFNNNVSSSPPELKEYRTPLMNFIKCMFCVWNRIESNEQCVEKMRPKASDSGVKMCSDQANFCFVFSIPYREDKMQEPSLFSLSIYLSISLEAIVDESFSH